MHAYIMLSLLAGIRTEAPGRASITTTARPDAMSDSSGSARTRSRHRHHLAGHDRCPGEHHEYRERCGGQHHRGQRLPGAQRCRPAECRPCTTLITATAKMAVTAAASPMATSI